MKTREYLITANRITHKEPRDYIVCDIEIHSSFYVAACVQYCHTFRKANMGRKYSTMRNSHTTIYMHLLAPHRYKHFMHKHDALCKIGTGVVVKWGSLLITHIPFVVHQYFATF